MPGAVTISIMMLSSHRCWCYFLLYGFAARTTISHMESVGNLKNHSTHLKPGPVWVAGWVSARSGSSR
jgi:hypothetical protein